MNNTFHNTLPLNDTFPCILEVSVTHITNRGETSAMLHTEASHGNNSQLVLKWPRYYIFCNNLQAKMNLVISQAIITHVTNADKAGAMLHIGTGHCNKSQIQ